MLFHPGYRSRGLFFAPHVPPGFSLLSTVLCLFLKTRVLVVCKTNSNTHTHTRVRIISNNFFYRKKILRQNLKLKKKKRKIETRRYQESIYPEQLGSRRKYIRKNFSKGGKFERNAENRLRGDPPSPGGGGRGGGWATLPVTERDKSPLHRHWPGNRHEQWAFVYREDRKN